MVWSHNDNWMVTGDHAGYVKYWQSNMNNVRMFQAHKEPVRGIRYALILNNDFFLFWLFVLETYEFFSLPTIVLVHLITNSLHVAMMVRYECGTFCDAKKSVYFEVMVLM